MQIRTRVLVRDVVLGAFVAFLLTTLSPNMSTPVQGASSFGGFFSLAHRAHCE
jgi:hypothetical protein